jgi:serine/threonine protein kinase
MPSVQTAESGTYRPFTKLAGAEPLPGYKLLEPLGRGGFGEVWKCEAPGGLLKAIKFVSGEETEDGRGEQRLHQELGAFQQIKSIRHPFLLTLERVEIIGTELMMVMELADRQLQDRFRECKAFGLPGIPRDELLAYFADAAEALDMIAAKYELQHLDVKPANLFLVAGHVKVGDYGLVARLHPDVSQADHRGLTPKYVAPEVLRGQPCNRSDQYSLALVYQELLTGTFPYEGKTPQQLMMHHIATKPNLSGLPMADRTIVARALAKKPDERFASCLGFVQALMTVPNAASPPSAGMDVRRARVDRSIADMNLPTGEPLDADEADGSIDSTGGRPRADATENVTLPVGPRRLLPASVNTPAPVKTPTPNIPQLKSGTLPQLVTNRRSGAVPVAATPRPVSIELDLSKPADSKYAVTLNKIRSILPVSRLLGQGGDDRANSADFINAVVECAAEGAYIPQMAGDIGRLADGSWFCRFPSTVSQAVAPLKLQVLHETWGVSIDQPDPTRIVLRKTQTNTGFWGAFSGKKNNGIEVAVRLPEGTGVGEIKITGTLFGAPTGEFARQAPDFIPSLMTEARSQLANVDDRRKHPRLPANFPVTLYPIHSAGGIDVPIHGTCRDVSLGGICVATEVPIPTKYAYGVFDDVEATAGFAILIRFLRTTPAGHHCLLGGQFRVDL